MTLSLNKKTTLESKGTSHRTHNFANADTYGMQPQSNIFWGVNIVRDVRESGLPKGIFITVPTVAV